MGIRTRIGQAKFLDRARCEAKSYLTKAMTAMLCGILVDEGRLKWDQTLGETFPELKKTMDPGYRAVTLRQLLATWVVHDLEHLAQVARVMAKQYADEVGPWVPFLPVLTDHPVPRS